MDNLTSYKSFNQSHLWNLNCRAVLWFVKRCAFPSYDRTIVWRRKTRWRWLKFRQKLIVKWTCHNLIFFDILQIAENGDSIPTSNLKNALDHVGIKLPMYRVRELLNDLKTQGKACDQKGVSKEVFREVRLHSCKKNNGFFLLVFLRSENQQMTHW